MSQNMSDKDPWGDNFSDQNFEFKEEFWHEAEELLQKDRKYSALRRFAVILSTVLFIGLWTWWVNENHPAFIQNSGQQNKEQLTFIDTADQLSPEKYRISPVSFSKNEFPLDDQMVDQLVAPQKSSEERSADQLTKVVQSVKKQPQKSMSQIAASVKRKDHHLNQVNTSEMTLIEQNGSPTIAMNYDKSVSNDLIEIKPFKYVAPRVKRSQWNISFGSGINVMTQTENKTLRQNFNAAVNYTFLQKDNFSASVGLGVKTVQMHGIDTTFTNKTYGFGSKKRLMDVSYNQNVYVHLPLSLSYHHKNHQFTAGLSFAHLAAVETSLATRKVEYKSNTNTLEDQTDKNYGIKKGINPLLIESSIGYAYQISPKLDVGLQVNLGMNDLTDNSFWSNDQKHRNFSANVQLRYHFLSKRY